MGDLRILIVDDDPACRLALEKAITTIGHACVSAPDGRSALEIVRESPVDVLISDWRMPHLDGLQLFRAIRSLHSAPRGYTYCILITGASSSPPVLEALEGGADDFIEKPVTRRSLRERLTVAQRIVRRREPATFSPRVPQISPQSCEPAEALELIGDSRRMREVSRLLHLSARADSAILLQGESGTGKELAARAAQRLSPRVDAPFIIQNCGAIPLDLAESELFGHVKGAFSGATRNHRGLFERANGGTLFLDEIGEISQKLQVKLLRVLEDGVIHPVGGEGEQRVDVRLIAATNRNLLERVREGHFREDLYYRLAVFPIDLPPLRLRHGDIDLLIDHFLGRHTAKSGCHCEVSVSARELLNRYRWPGNVRELLHVIERCIVLARNGCIEPSHLPAQIRRENVDANRVSSDRFGTVSEKGVGFSEGEGRLGSTAFALPREDRERAETHDALHRSNGNRTQAARMLGMSRAGLWKRMKRLGME